MMDEEGREDIADELAEMAAGPAATAGPESPLVMVIDDHDQRREALIVVLKEMAYRVLAVEDAGQALELLHGGVAPCLIVLDLLADGAKARAFRHAQEADGTLARIPTIALTAPDAETRLTGLAATLPRPISVARLLDVVAAHCPR
jgi:CheY-like chemotaxis protein